MENNSTYENDLIIRYLSGEAGEEEILQLSAWLGENPENRKIFEEYKAIWTGIDSEVVRDIDIDQEWNRIEKRIHEPAVLRLTPRTSLNIFYRVAAALVILMIPAFFIYRTLTAPVEKDYTASNGILEGFLPDGTVFTLNKGSVLKYKGDGKTRNISLDGEAYFRVFHDSEHPFIVSSGEMRIEALGTSFMVNTEGNKGSLEVVLDTGKVAVYKNVINSEKAYLIPGQKAVVTGDMISVSSNTDINYLSWKTKRLVFTDETLAAILASMEKVYGTDVILAEPELAVCRVTATFNNQSPESVLNVLKETLSLSMDKKGGRYILSGKGCRSR